jgi:hypothetical protein
MTKESGKGLYKKRYATLKEHKAAVAASKTNKGGKNVGPVAHGQSYANSLKVKPAEKKPAPAAKPAPKASAPKPTAPKATPKTGDGSVKAIPVKRTGSTEVKKTEPKKEAVKPKRHRGGSRSRPTGNARVSNKPQTGATRKVRRGRGTTGVTQMWDGTKWVTGKLGSKGGKG